MLPFSAYCQFAVNTFQSQVEELPLFSPLIVEQVNTTAQLALFVTNNQNVDESAFLSEVQQAAYSIKESPSPIVHGYKWSHLRESTQLETAFTQELNLAYKLKNKDAEHTYYNLGLALVRPSETSIAWNTPMASDAFNDRLSTFLSFSVHSRF